MLLAVAVVVGWRVGGKAAWLPFAAAATAIGVLAATRRAWELGVRRPAWLVDAARGLWLERGVDWLLAASALAVGASLVAWSDAAQHKPSWRVAWSGALALAVLAAAALAWGVSAVP